MSASTMLLILVSLVSFVVGQLLLKLAVGEEDEGKAGEAGEAGDQSTAEKPFIRRVPVFAGGIVGMTISFFINLGLLQQLPLSFLFPFQGLSVLIVTLGACIFLRERLSLPLIIGAMLITAGVMLVSAS